MASSVPVAGETFTFGCSAISQADTNIFQAAATIAAGDFQRSINGGAFANLDNTPTVTPAAGKRIQFVISAAETTAAGAGGEIYIVGSDQVGDEWKDFGIAVRVFASNLDALATAADLATVDGVVDAILVATGTDIPASIAALNDLSAAEVWAYGTRTLTQTAAEIEAALSGNTITAHRGDTLSVSLTGLGSLAGYTALDFTVKRSTSDSDDEAVIRIRKNASGEDDGLLRLNGAEAAAGDGSLVIDDEAAGNVTVNLAASAMAQLSAWSGYHYDVQEIMAMAVDTKTEGLFVVPADVTRAVV